MNQMNEGLPEGVVLKFLTRHKDDRGYFQEHEQIKHVARHYHAVDPGKHKHG